MIQRPYLDYYTSAEIVPVHQDLSDFAAHVRRRKALYRLLGLPPLAFRGARLLEIGPGTGDNALATMTFDPISYMLLDGNPSSLFEVRNKVADGTLDPERCVVVEGDYLALPAESVVLSSQFDIVLAEGCVPFQLDPVAALKAVARLVSEIDGVLVVTTTDEVSMLSEICRRYMKPAIAHRSGGDPKKALDLSCIVFESHYANLPAASRPLSDWILDNILHPWTRDWALSMSSAIDALPDFDYLGSTPNYSTDWRWYKSFADPRESWSDVASRRWNDTLEFTLDWRSTPPLDGTSSGRIGADLGRLCREFGRLVDDAWRADSYDNVKEVDDKLMDVQELIKGHPGLSQTSQALDDFRASLSTLTSGDLNFPYRSFLTWWGRGMQYLSLTRGA